MNHIQVERLPAPTVVSSEKPKESLSSAALSPDQMTQFAEQYAYKKATNTTAKTLSLALSAGVFIGLAFVFYITVTTGSSGVGWGVSRLLGGLAFSLGLVMLVVCGGELFTSSVLSIIPRANGQLNTRAMLANWSKVYLGNFVGALLLVLVVSGAKLYQLDHGQWGLNALSIAQHKLEHGFMQAVMLGMLCNLLVCLAVWMTFSAKTSAAKAALVILPVAMFVSTGFEHVVANMFMVPLGIAIKAWAEPSFWAQVGVQASAFEHLTWANFASHNLIPVTIGNIIGGAVIVGLGYWSVYSRGSQLEPVRPKFSVLSNQYSGPVGEPTMQNLKTITVADIMSPADNALSPDMTIASACDALVAQELSGAVVVNENNELQGFVSELEILRKLWLEDYSKPSTTTVASIMQKDIMTVAPNHNLLKLAEYMSVDVAQVYPVSESGVLLSSTHQPLEERLRNSSVYRPKIFPVVDSGKLVGVVTRHQVLKALRPALGAPVKLEEPQAEVAESVA
ncbi:formate transporter FocA [Agarivorans sp. B2Z047]|uniref:formate transporter FocA n=1 Tax=Agarivorans sp. B2Z047 TaxID=2652721 RepID=UPI00128E0EDF|nr:formate transporter FocA [Agarivorans sp. B2Z047]MPW30543.1 formate transporter FocA [Agarivorans sp. B2Z047]UQN42235.1 formate transporter FocA [Agarivorans sp. B2Z047]